MNGLVAVDKPEKLSSAAVVARLKRMTGAKKVGHTGTLDPFATGLMLCGFNNGTRLSRFFLHGDKKYTATLHLGIETDTQDLTGEIISETQTDFSDDFERKIMDVASSFEGPQKQSPPSYSALKHNGVPLYKLARKGIHIEKPPRDVCIHYIRIIAIDLPCISFEVSCSSGTYIRTLASDMGKSLGFGAHLKALRRIETCGFSVDKAMTLEEAQELCASGDFSGKLIGMSEAIPNMVSVVADRLIAEKIGDGKPVFDELALPLPTEDDDQFVKILDDKENLLAIINSEKDAMKYNYCCVFHKNI